MGDAVVMEIQQVLSAILSDEHLGALLKPIRASPHRDEVPRTARAARASREAQMVSPQERLEW